MKASPRIWEIDPVEPRAPEADVFEAMTPGERERVYAMLPENPYPLCNLMGEGDLHRKVTASAADALEQWFVRRRRRAYIGRGSTVYYPGEPTFAPDVYVVLDAEPGERKSWLVSREGRGLDVVFEIHHFSERSKDVRRNVEWFARLGIPEYFVLEIASARLSGWRLPEGAGRYERLPMQHAQLRSELLDLELCFENGRVRFYSDGARLSDRDDLIARLTSALDTLTIRAEEEAKRADAAERRLAELLAQLAEGRPK